MRRTQVGGVAEVVDDGECEVEVPRLHVPRGAYQLRDDAPHLLDRTVCEADVGRDLHRGLQLRYVLHELLACFLHGQSSLDGCSGVM